MRRSVLRQFGDAVAVAAASSGMAMIASLALGVSASAHGGADERFKIALMADHVRVETSLPVGFVAELADGDGDGVVTQAELLASQAAVAAWIDARLGVTDIDDAALPVIFADHPGILDHHNDDRATHIRILRRYGLAPEQTAGWVTTQLFVDRDKPVRALIITPKKAQRGRIKAGLAEIRLALTEAAEAADATPESDPMPDPTANPNPVPTSAPANAPTGQNASPE